MEIRKKRSQNVGQKMAHGKWTTENGREKLADRKWATENSRQIGAPPSWAKQSRSLRPGLIDLSRS